MRPRHRDRAIPFGTKATFAVSTASIRPEPARSRLIRRSTITVRRGSQPSGLTKDHIPRLRARWLEEISDITGPIPLVLPPFREVNHCIPLIDPSKQIKHRYSKCPDSLRPQLMDKIERYIAAGWWEEKNVPQASPLLCIPKKDGRLRTVVDCRERNLNTIKDLTPFPDQDMIRNDVARAPFRSKLDMSDAYEQVRVEPNDVKNTAFCTVVGTYLSHVVQQGDCNAPATFQRLMTRIFRKFIAKFVYVYLDDIFIFSKTIEEHEDHLRKVFDVLRAQSLYLSAPKVDLYSERMDCLGHRIDDQGLHADSDKMKSIRHWPHPQDYNDVQKFLGMINYLAQFMPDVSAYTSPLSGMSRMKVWTWGSLHEKCFVSLKSIACRTPILRPIDCDRAKEHGETIYLVCDASVAGVGAFYGQGVDWQTSRPAGFLSKKFSSAQHAYRTYEQETLAILEGLLRWEDKLLGREITIITDHRTLEFFNTQRNMSMRQVRWYEYLSRFRYTIQYVEGIKNVVADALSRMYAGRNDSIPIDDWVNADVRLDPEGETLPIDRLLESRAMQLRPRGPGGAVLKERAEPRVLESLELQRASVAQPNEVQETPVRTADTNAGVSNSTAEPHPQPSHEQSERIERIACEEDMAWSSGSPPTPLEVHLEGDDFLAVISSAYKDDTLFSKVLLHPEHHP